MEKVAEKIDSLIKELQEAIRKCNEQVDAVAKERITVEGHARELEIKSADVLEREAAIAPIENAVSIMDNAGTMKAESELESSKLDIEKDDFNHFKKSELLELSTVKKDLNEKIDLYNRGAEENNKKQESLKKKMDAFKTLKV